MPPFAVRVEEPPGQIPAGDAVTETTGKGFTFTVADIMVVQPETEIPVREYIVVTVGLAIGLAQLVQLNPVAGDHE